MYSNSKMQYEMSWATGCLECGQLYVNDTDLWTHVGNWVKSAGLFCGQASRPAIRRLQFWAEARPHFCGQRTKDRERERAFAKYANYDAVDKEAFFLCH